MDLNYLEYKLEKIQRYLRWNEIGISTDKDTLERIAINIRTLLHLIELEKIEKWEKENGYNEDKFYTRKLKND